MRDFDSDTLKLITTFEDLTGSFVRDCINSDRLYFLVDKGMIAVAIGKEGNKIKNAERILGKPIKLFEWNEEGKEFIKNLIPQAQKIEIKNSNASVSIENKNRGAVIGSGGNNIKIIRELLGRNSEIKDLKVL